MVGPERPQIVLFGSSIVQLSFSNGGWGAILSDLYARKADIILRGYSAWNSTRALQVIERIFPKDAAIQPSLVIVYFGGNDSVGPHSSGLGPHVPLSEYIENMKKIAIHIKGLSKKTRLIFLSAPPVCEEQIRKEYSTKSEMALPMRTNELCRQYSDSCLELCKEMNIKAVDLWTSITKVKNWQTTCFSDGIHFTCEASKVVVKEILKVLKEEDWEPNLHYNSLPTEFDEDSPFDPVLADGSSTFNVSKKVPDRLLCWGNGLFDI